MSRKTTRLEDIARLAGVSIATASRALNDSPAVNDRTKQTIWKLAKEHDYPFRRHMPAGPIGAQGTIALVVPRPQGREGRLSDPFFLELLAGHGNTNLAPLRELDGVADQVVENLAESAGIAEPHRLHGLVNPQNQFQVLFCGGGRHQPDHLFQTVLKIKGPVLENHFVRLDF